jgi:hypothetical protein
MRRLLLERLRVKCRDKLHLVLLGSAIDGLHNFLAIIPILCTDWLDVKVRVNDH